MSVSRLVTLMTPVFAALAGWACDLAVRYLPGAPALDRGELTALFVAGATSATAASVKWLHGRSKWELQDSSETAHAERVRADYANGQVEDLRAQLAALEARIDAPYKPLPTTRKPRPAKP